VGMPQGRGQGAGAAAQGDQGSTQSRTPAVTDPKKLARIEGRVVNAATGEPIPRASLTLAGAAQGASSKAARSDSEGRFVMESLQPGTYRLTGDRIGFLRQGYGSRTPGGTAAPLNLAESQSLKDVELRLTPQGVILGTVLDDEGDPTPRAMVTATQLGSSASCGTRRRGDGRNGASKPAEAQPRRMTSANLRIAGLTPGRYTVVAMPGRGGPGGRGGGMPGASSSSPGGRGAPADLLPVHGDAAAAAPVVTPARRSAASRSPL
jgi:hypothetical protein